MNITIFIVKMRNKKLIKFPSDCLDNLQDYKHLLNNKYSTEF